MLSGQPAMSKSQQKRQEKAAQIAWSQTNLPKDSMGLHNAVMYLQNVLVAIKNEIACKCRYSLFYRFIARTNILQMQKEYDDAKSHARPVDEKQEVEQNECQDNFKYPLPEFPLSQQAMKEYHKEIEDKM